MSASWLNLGFASQYATLGTGIPHRVEARYYTSLTVNPTANTVPMVEGRAYALPIVITKSVTIDRIAILVDLVGGEGSVVRAGLYNANQATADITTLIVDAGTASVETGGVKEYTVSQAMPPGVFYVVVVCQGAAATRPALRGQIPSGSWRSTSAPFSGNSPYPGLYGNANTVPGALPDPLGVPFTGNDAAMPTTMVRFTA